MKKNKHPLFTSTLILTGAGLVSRVMGFFYKIFLASLIGAEGLGVYQMVFPIYILCVSLASSGIQTAISRFTAERMSTGRCREARSLFHSGLVLSLLLAGFMTGLLLLLSRPLSLYLLKEARCEPLLRLMALAIPFEALHTCANGFFLGQKKPLFPALSQLLEQSVRIGSTVLFFQILLQRGLTSSPLLAAAGLLTAELLAALLALTVLVFQNRPQKREASRSLRRSLSAIFSVALPITGNRLMLNLLQSVEAVLIPLRLQMYCGNASTALSTYGIFTGMALPLILFPSAITGSFSMILLPSVSEAHAQKDQEKIAATVSCSLLLCLTLGVLCTCAFQLFGPALGLLLYGERRVGLYLTTLAWICPFLYLNTTVSSILYGLGKTLQVFFHNMAGLLLRLLFIYFCVPVFGIQGCLWGLLVGQLLTALLGILRLRRCVRFSLNVTTSLLLPLGCCLSGTVLLRVLQKLFPLLTHTELWIPFLLSAGIWGLTVLLLYTLPGRKHLHKVMPQAQ